MPPAIWNRSVLRPCKQPLLATALLCSFPLHPATANGANTTGVEGAAEPTDETVQLNPFTVSSEQDRGYAADRAISGTRLNTELMALPMPIEVITDQFIRDIGATNLREALQYSAGIQLRSQNDYAGNGLAQYQNPGGVNNPEMQTANKTDTTVVVRGFTTDNSLRDGFRRRVTTDIANVSRIEVVRGPSTLLYGVGNFGGVVNYLPKRPLPGRREGALTFNVGSFGLERATIDYNTPVALGSAPGVAGFRFNAAAQANGDATDDYHTKRWAVAPIFLYRPSPYSELTIDVEYGRTLATGIGFQSIRARADALANDGREEHAGLIAFPGVNLRTMRWSGPDTYQRSYQGNLELKFTQHLADGLDLLAGYNHSSVTFDTRDVNAGIGNNLGPVGIWATITPVPLDAERGDTDANWAGAPIPHSIVAYSWQRVNDGTRADQGRIELSYRRRVGERARWYSFDNTVLVGADTERDHTARSLSGLDATNHVYDWKSPADPSPFRFATQGDGTPSLPLKLRSIDASTTREAGGYVVYHGRFLDDRLTVLTGMRIDRSGVSTVHRDFSYATGAQTGISAFDPTEKSIRAYQFGASFAVAPGLSVYALRSKGISPNFSGARDLTGRPMDAVVATNQEFGVKLDLFKGRVTGTLSRYRITRSGQPNATFWWAPQTAVHHFDPAQPVVYNVTDLNPDAAAKYFYTDNSGSNVPLIQWNNNYAYWGDLRKLSTVPAGAAGTTATTAGLQSYQNDGLNGQRGAIVSAWSQAKSSGAVKYWDNAGKPIDEATFANLVSHGGPGAGLITVSASTPQGAAYLDAVYDYTRAAGTAHPGSDNWPGWYFNSAPASTGYNSAAQDTNSFANNPPLSAPESDRNEGWDGQLIFTPIDDLQLVFSFEVNHHTIRSLGQFPRYPYQDKDRWALWMFPNGQWGLSGYYGKNVQYANEADTSTFSFKGLIYPGAQGMDYPKRTWSAFANYRLTSVGLKSLRFGGGVIRTGPQEYESGFTHSGDALKDTNGQPLILSTRPRWTVNLFARYDFKLRRRDAYIQLNVDNVLDDQHRYGLLWAPGRSVNLGYGITF